MNFLNLKIFRTLSVVFIVLSVVSSLCWLLSFKFKSFCAAHNVKYCPAPLIFPRELLFQLMHSVHVFRRRLESRK